MRIVFLDTETTGLEPDADVWDFACIVRDPGVPDREVQFFIHHDREKALRLPEPFLSDYMSRFGVPARLRFTAAQEIVALTEGAVIVGCVPNFDTERLAVLIRSCGLEPRWHYQLQDAETRAVGYLDGRASLGAAVPDLPLPWDSEAISRAVGVNPDDFERHTALGDARWARAVYDAVTGG